MFDIGWPELLLVAVLVIVVVGPKDLPRVMRTVAHYVGKAKSMTREFRGYVDDMVRESELDEIKSQIEAGADLDAGGLMENTIDPDHDLRDSLEFADGDFDDGEFDTGSDLSELDAEPYDEVAGGGGFAEDNMMYIVAGIVALLVVAAAAVAWLGNKTPAPRPAGKIQPDAFVGGERDDESQSTSFDAQVSDDESVDEVGSGEEGAGESKKAYQWTDEELLGAGWTPEQIAARRNQ